MTQKQSSPEQSRPSHRLARTLGPLLGLAFGAALPAGHAVAQSRNVSPAEWNKVVDAAKKEGKVILYATMAPAVHDRIVAAFNANNPGIKMELVRVVGAAMTTKFEAERQAPNVEGGDAMITADVRWAMNIQKQGLLKTPVGPNASNWPESMMKNGQIVFLGINPWVMSYNTNLVKNPVTSYKDLLRPEFNGKIGSTALVAEVVTIWWKWVDDTNPGLLDTLAKQGVKMYPSSVAASNSVASGEILVNNFSVIPIEGALAANKAPTRMVITNPAYGFSYGGAIVGWAKNPNAAAVAMDFLMSVRGQQALVGNEEAASPLKGVPGSLDTSKINLQLLDWDKATPESLKAFEGRWNKLFGTR